MATQTILVDIDGTLADQTHRQHFVSGPGPKDWDAFFMHMAGDAPIWPVVDLVRSLKDRGNTIIFVTGRPERYRGVTYKWLEGAGFESPFNCHMRPDNDRRADDIIKEEILNSLRASGYRPTIAIDDRKAVVAMWRRNGIICLQCNEGDF